MKQKEYTISIKDIKEIVHREVFNHMSVKNIGGEVASEERWVNDIYTIKFDEGFPIKSIECEKEPRVEFENGVVRVVSSKLDKVLSVLNSKVYNK